jgi:hypothetical protein
MQHFALGALAFVLVFGLAVRGLALEPEMEAHLSAGLSGGLSDGSVSYDATLQGEPGSYTLELLGSTCRIEAAPSVENPAALELVFEAQQPGGPCIIFDRVQITAAGGRLYAVRTLFRGRDTWTDGAGGFVATAVQAPTRAADTLPPRPDPGKPVTRATAALLQQFLPAGSQQVPLGKTDLGICADGTRYANGSPDGGHCVSVAQNSDLARAGLETHDRIFYVLMDVGAQALIGDDAESIFLMLGRGHIGRVYEIHYEKRDSRETTVTRFQATDWYFERYGDQFGNRSLAGLPSISRNCRAERVVVQLSGVDEFNRNVPADACRKIIFVPEGWSFALPNHGLTAEYRGYAIQRYRR